MSAITVPQMIPDATYRIRTASDDALYFQIDASSGDVVPKALNTSLDTQKWNVKGNTADSTFTLVNVGTQTQLSIRDSGDKDDTGNVIYELTTFDTGLSWTIEPRGPNFVIGLATDNTCVDFSAGSKLLVWSRNGLINQRWILEQIAGTIVPPKFVDPAPTPGQIRLYNGSKVLIDGWITNSSNPSDTKTWWGIAPGTYISRPRTAEEAVAVRINGGPTGEPGALTAGGAAQPGTVVAFYGLYPHPGLVIGN